MGMVPWVKAFYPAGRADEFRASLMALLYCEMSTPHNLAGNFRRPPALPG